MHNSHPLKCCRMHDCGLGIDRLTMLLVGESIKDAEFLFRGPNRLTP